MTTYGIRVELVNGDGHFYDAVRYHIRDELTGAYVATTQTEDQARRLIERLQQETPR